MDPKIETMETKPKQVKDSDGIRGAKPPSQKTKKQIDAAKRFKKFYDTKVKDKDLKRTCDCGSIVGYMSMSRHKKSPKHARIMKELRVPKEPAGPSPLHKELSETNL